MGMRKGFVIFSKREQSRKRQALFVVLSGDTPILARACNPGEVG
jgi:hypothetical protein